MPVESFLIYSESQQKWKWLNVQQCLRNPSNPFKIQANVIASSQYLRNPLKILMKVIVSSKCLRNPSNPIYTAANSSFLVRLIFPQKVVAQQKLANRRKMLQPNKAFAKQVGLT